MAKTKVVKQVVRRQIPRVDPRRLDLYGIEHHGAKGRENQPWRQQLDPPVEDIVLALSDQVPCVECTENSCAGKCFTYTEKFSDLWQGVDDPIAREALEAMKFTDDVVDKPEKDPDFGRAYDVDAHIELIYKTDESNLPDALKLETALTSSIYEFGDGSDTFKGKIHCPERGGALAGSPQRTYELRFNRPVTPIMLECMWGVFRGIVEPFKES